MTKKYYLECLGDEVVMIVDKEKGVAFDGWDEKAEMAFIGFGDTERSPCWIVARALDDDKLDEALLGQTEESNPPAIVALVMAGADVNTIIKFRELTPEERTPLHRAAGHGDVATIETLIDLGADINARDIYGMTPLLYARGIETAKVLIAAGADVNDGEADGWTLLHYAVDDGTDIKFTKFLLEAGADVYAQDSEGDAPLRLAKHLGHRRMVTLLEAWIAEHPDD